MFEISLFTILCRKLLIKNILVQTLPILSFKLYASRLYVALTRLANQANLKKIGDTEQVQLSATLFEQIMCFSCFMRYGSHPPHQK
jgi:galactitol-specific phosphotransferase system IIC component